MSQDYSEATNEELIMVIAIAYDVLAKWNAYKSVSETMNTQAGILFSEGRDAEALQVRTIADNIKRIAFDERKLFDNEQQENKRQAWKELEKRGIC